MNKFIFVCYLHGAGGEKLSVDISNLQGIETLKYEKIGERFWTHDYFKKFFLTYKKDWRTKLRQHYDMENWHVVPSHYASSVLQEHFGDSIFVTVGAPSNNEEREIIKQKILDKVWFTGHDTLQGKIGYFYQNGGKELNKDLLQKINKCKLNVEILCLIHNVEFNDSNVEALYKKGSEYLFDIDKTWKYAQGDKSIIISFRDLYEKTDEYQKMFKRVQKMAGISG